MQQLITPTTPISELIHNYPQVVDVLTTEYNFYCARCLLAGFDTLEEGAKLHQITGDDFTALLNHINQVAAQEIDTFKNKPLETVPTPQTISTQSAERYQTHNHDKIMIINLNNCYFYGPGIKDWTKLFELWHKEYQILPSQYFNEFNKLRRDWQRGHLSWVDLVDQLGKHVNVTWTNQANTFLEAAYIPQRARPITETIEKLAIDKQELWGILAIGKEQLAKLKQKGWLLPWRKLIVSFESGLLAEDHNMGNHLQSLLGNRLANATYYDTSTLNNKQIGQSRIATVKADYNLYKQLGN